MKKKAIIALLVVGIVVLPVAIRFCVSPRKEIPSKELAYQQLGTQGEQFVLEQIEGLPRDSIIEKWGKPDGMLSGFYGDIWELTDDKRIIVYYSAQSTVEQIKFSQETE